MVRVRRIGEGKISFMIFYRYYQGDRTATSYKIEAIDWADGHSR